MFKVIDRWWRKRQRDVDLNILWPMLKEQTESIDDARFAFFAHCEIDSAWVTDYKHDELIEFIQRLK